MNKKLDFVLLLIYLFILALFSYKWYQNKQKINQTSNLKEPIPTVFVPITLNPTQILQVNEQVKKDEETTQVMDAYREKTPLLYLMPYITTNFRIDYIGEYKYRITLLGVDKVESRKEALQFWQNHKIDPATIDLVWKEN